MTAPVLPKTLGEAAAFFADDHAGSVNLYDILVQMMKAGAQVNGYNASTITTGVKGSVIATFDGVLGLAAMSALDNGSAGNTVVAVVKNGVTVASLTCAHDTANGTVTSSDLSTLSAAAFVVGDLIEVEVTTAPTSGTDLTVSCQMRPVSLGV